MYENLPSDWVTFFVIVGIITVIGIVPIIGALVYYDLKKRITIFFKNKRRQNTNKCCQICGAYTPYYRDRYGTKWFVVDYCPRCGHNMQNERRNQ